MLSMKMVGLKDLQKELKAIGENEIKSLSSAVKVEAFRLRKVMMKEIRDGAPGDKQFAPLSYIARGVNIRTSRKIRKDRPLIRLANAVTYNAFTTRGGFVAKVGFTERSPAEMRYLARIHQTGFTRPISPKLRKMIIREGSRRGSIEGGRTPYFLRKTTTEFKTPARKIIEPFWNKHKNEAWNNIARNYRAKKLGGRI